MVAKRTWLQIGCWAWEMKGPSCLWSKWYRCDRSDAYPLKDKTHFEHGQVYFWVQRNHRYLALRGLVAWVSEVKPDKGASLQTTNSWCPLFSAGSARPSADTSWSPPSSVKPRKRKPLPPQAVNSVIDGLKRLYVEKIKPLEEAYLFGPFHSPPLVSSGPPSRSRSWPVSSRMMVVEAAVSATSSCPSNQTKMNLICSTRLVDYYVEVRVYAEAFTSGVGC